MNADTARVATYTLRLAADRAADLAEIFRSRAAVHPRTRATMLLIAGHLSTAAEALRCYVPPVFDGVTVTNTTPAEAGFALMEAMAAAAEDPALGLPDELFYVVTAPITRRPLHKLLPELKPLSKQLASQEDRIRTAVRLIEHTLDQPCDPVTRYAALVNVVELCRNYRRVSDSVEVDNASPRHRR
jgi:hypothetical protein